jgi:hypothetical protein
VAEVAAYSITMLFIAAVVLVVLVWLSFATEPLTLRRKV